MLSGGVLAACVGALLIVPCLRMGVYSTAIVTLAFGEILRIIATSWTGLTKGEMGLWGIPPIFDGVSKAPYVYLVGAILALGLAMLRGVVRSPLGLSFVAIKDDETAASTSGIAANRMKVVATAISCFAAGIAGSFYAHYILTITPILFGIGYTIQVMAMSLFGGKATLLGPFFGAFFLILMGESFRFVEDYRHLIYGALIIGTVMLFPEGLAGIASRIRTLGIWGKGR
jgi:branched-chain amino acid transport system permease protein